MTPESDWTDEPSDVLLTMSDKQRLAVGAAYATGYAAGVRKVSKQRDDLLAACKEMAEILWNKPLRAPEFDVLGRACEAIAQAERIQERNL